MTRGHNAGRDISFLMSNNKNVDFFWGVVIYKLSRRLGGGLGMQGDLLALKPVWLPTFLPPPLLSSIGCNNF